LRWPKFLRGLHLSIIKVAVTPTRPDHRHLWSLLRLLLTREVLEYLLQLRLLLVTETAGVLLRTKSTKKPSRLLRRLGNVYTHPVTKAPVRWLLRHLRSLLLAHEVLERAHTAAKTTEVLLRHLRLHRRLLTTKAAAHLRLRRASHLSRLKHRTSLSVSALPVRA
jgi:hypothetical protein